MWSHNDTVVVAGNGSSLARLLPGCVLASDRIVRTNNFFFEPESYLGTRVDLAFMAGDPRVAPFMFETLWRHGRDYDLRGWTSHDPRVIRAGKRRFAPGLRPLRPPAPDVARAVETLTVRHQRRPNTGTRAVLAAHAMGARHILLAGIDLHSGSQRYVYPPGRRMRALMGQDLGARGPDRHLHDPALDLAILAMLRDRDDLVLERACDSAALAEILPAAAARPGPGPDRAPRRAPTDWVGRVGLYPMALLLALRRASALTRRTPT